MTWGRRGLNLVTALIVPIPECHSPAVAAFTSLYLVLQLSDHLGREQLWNGCGCLIVLDDLKRVGLGESDQRIVGLSLNEIAYWIVKSNQRHCRLDAARLPTEDRSMQLRA